MSRVIVVLLMVVLLSGCSPRGIISIVQGLPTTGAELQRVYVATNRNPARAAPRQLFQQSFGETRDPTLRFARLDISIPPIHREGQIEWPNDATPDPALHFVVTDEATLTAPGFVRSIRADQASGRREVVVFVHGFNTNNAEVVYRLAQIAHDFEAEVPVIAYSWPSAGSPRGYAYDRDSVIFSRDGLETLLATLIADGRTDVLLVAHSMGSQLVMETLRQMSISGRSALLTRISGVALISPDIDEDVFLQQAKRIRPFPQPFTLLVSRRDRILDISAFLTGKPTRLGSIRDGDRLEGLPVTIIDLSDIEGGDPTGHHTAFTAPAAIALLRDLDPDG